MIKIEIDSKGRAGSLPGEVKAWCEEHISPDVPQGKHNQKKRKLWHVKVVWPYTKVFLFVRRPKDHTLAALRWL
jgi:hypothetical protein